MNKFTIIIAVLILGLITLYNSAYMVDETQTALVFQFGEPVGDTTGRQPGLHFKVPFVQNVVYLDRRLLEYDVGSTIIYTKDKKNLDVDAYVRWRISDPLRFYQAFKSEGSSAAATLEVARRRMGNVIIGELKSELGLHIMSDIISETRGAIMSAVTNSSNIKLDLETGSKSGIQVVDVRIIKADLPPENQASVYTRMMTERKQQADKYRSEGKREAEKLMAQVNFEKEQILAEANRTSQEIKGKADAEAARIYADAYGVDPEFYGFVRSLESYEKSLTSNSTMIMSPRDMDYLKYFMGIKN